ncbi:hypothetical protein RUM43_010791 [Polyplax serrata]|uniref:G-protein coupled receptors family 1 profile domain-containing protein n=1 Tax=Polyplax serrata TaxID=468196 RepID=A0AAN8Q599_POLSC
MNNSTLEFGNETLKNETFEADESAVLYAFYTNGVLLNVVAFFGIFGNIISMIILSRPQMRSSINYLLIGLARCDIVLIITSILLFGLPAIHDKTGLLFTYAYKIYPHIAPVVFPLALIAQTVTVYLTLTVTLERFVAVCHPLQARSLCTYGRARLYVILIIVFATLYNLPRFLEASREEHFEEEFNTTVYLIRASPLRQNELYISIYVYWLYLLFIYFLPFTFLAVLNAAIYRQVRRANLERARLSRLQKKEIGLATMLLCVVIVFFFCNILALVNNLLEAFYGVIYDQLVKTSNLLVTINSSVNFVVYVTFGEKFKRLFLKLFCSPFSTFLGTSGRESPDATHDLSLISNGDNRSYSIRNTHTGSLTRAGTNYIKNGGTYGNEFKKHRSKSCRSERRPSLVPCVYYPGRSTATTELESTSLNQL